MGAAGPLRPGAARRCGPARPAPGFALMMALIALVIVSLAAVAAVHRAATEARREREEQLLFVGGEYRRALQRYAAFVPVGGVAQFPARLEDLLEDRRLPNPPHYLRRLYPDPMTGKNDWVLETLNGAPDGRIIGLHSASTDATLRRANLGRGNAALEGARTYAMWRFLGTDPMPGPEAGGSGAPGAGPADPGADPAPAPAPPPPPPNPNDLARLACYQAYGAPNARCMSPPYPQGSDTPSCVVAYHGLLRQCLQQIIGAGGSN